MTRSQDTSAPASSRGQRRAVGVGQRYCYLLLAQLLPRVLCENLSGRSCAGQLGLRLRAVTPVHGRR